ncbi:Sas10 C-terminal domain-containing protein [Rhodocollybia butyracea]|uniref:Sas10 C-terminal domain-containing protein n=1 Tax=Rhodocollybia butyracea TaxID=206335 RepID=A0A9P5Q9T7_9AGAR|nr:Sas10 C-terminal domain-containing protein [Rhodocollybia butyracea]
MPRRPSKKSKNPSKPRKLGRSDATLNKWSKRSDIPRDEEDQFHDSRDQILLEEGSDEGDRDIEDDEVFALQMLDAENDEDHEDDEDDHDQDSESVAVDSKPQKETRKFDGKRKGKEKGKLSDSDGEEEEEEETWGGKSAYYSSNAAQIDSDDEEALQLEIQEAKRLQAKSRENMNDDDFGLEDPIELTTDTTSSDILDVHPVVRPMLQDKTSILGHLQKTDPESLALAGDWTDSAQSLVKIKQKLEQLEAEESSERAFALGMMHLHYQTLLTYTTTLAYYLHLRASQKYAQKPELLRSHPIMQRLLKLKQSLITLEDLDFAATNDEEDDALDEEYGAAGLDDGSLDEDEMMRDATELWDEEGDNDEADDVDSDELQDILADARVTLPKRDIIRSTEPTPTAPPKKKRKTDVSGKAVVPVFDLVEPEFISSKSLSSGPASVSTDAFGEATSLQHADATDKSARRKTLRFHTSRIEGASARRSNARSNTLGGDDDIPYRERKKEKEERLAREAKARGRTQGGADLDDTEPQPRPDGDGDGEQEMEGADGYYQLIKKQTKDKKDKKKAEYEAAREQERHVVLLLLSWYSADCFSSSHVEEETATGPRSLTRAILANKGLTPHRPKSVRNPRVKKKIRFAKAQRKVASQKAVYKGGVSSTGGHYEGEKSGISKVVKSVRLG